MEDHELKDGISIRNYLYLYLFSGSTLIWLVTVLMAILRVRQDFISATTTAVRHPVSLFGQEMVAKKSTELEG